MDIDQSKLWLDVQFELERRELMIDFASEGRARAYQKINPESRIFAEGAIPSGESLVTHITEHEIHTRLQRRFRHRLRIGRVGQKMVRPLNYWARVLP